LSYGKDGDGAALGNADAIRRAEAIYALHLIEIGE
jgi:hypothetical protein